MASKLRGRLEAGENPAIHSLVLDGTLGICFCLQISRSGVKVKIDGGGANSDRAEVRRVVIVAGISRLSSSGDSSSVDSLADVRISDSIDIKQ